MPGLCRYNVSSSPRTAVFTSPLCHPSFVFFRHNLKPPRPPSCRLCTSSSSLVDLDVTNHAVPSLRSFQQNYRSPAQIAAETSGWAKPAKTELSNSSKHITNNCAFRPVPCRCFPTNGLPVGNPWPADGSHALNVGGLPLASDSFLLEKQQTFVREKIVERRVHAAGSGHFGFFEVTKDVSKLTKAEFLSEIGKKTPVFLRFSTVTFGKEFPDLGRNPRGFAVKFYTAEGYKPPFLTHSLPCPRTPPSSSPSYHPRT